jgi:hypothetical protein
LKSERHGGILSEPRFFGSLAIASISATISSIDHMAAGTSDRLMMTQAKSEGIE